MVGASLVLVTERLKVAKLADSGIPSADVMASVYFEVINEVPTLSDADSDGDLIPDALEGFGDDDGDGIANYLDNVDIALNILPSDVDNQNQFLIEGPVGASVRKGHYSAGNENGGGTLSDDDVDTQLTEDSEAENVGVIFDFVVDDLPTVGQSYSVVLPQQQAIPANAFYRKFIQQAWVTFTVDELNQIFSAEGERGYCPRIEEEGVWEVGLIEGYWCVQLSIEDGGPNDDDGVANGSIVDPGGVAVAVSDNRFPVVVDDHVSIAVNTTTEVDVLGNDTDEDEDTLSLSSAVANLGVSEIGLNGELIYTPPEDFFGSDFVIYSISDGNGGSASGTLIIEIMAPFQPEIPGEPEEPETPDEPEEPETPDEPDTPDEPETPDEPDSVDDPVEPEVPVLRVNSRGSGGGSMGWFSLFVVYLLCFRRLRIQIKKG